MAKELRIKLRFLPKATPELNAIDHLWRQVKGRGLANLPTQSTDGSAGSACRQVFDMSRHEHLQSWGAFGKSLVTPVTALATGFLEAT
jgi:transposase